MDDIVTGLATEVWKRRVSSHAVPRFVRKTRCDHSQDISPASCEQYVAELEQRMAIDLTARHVFAYNGEQLQLADEHTLVFGTGNALAFTSTVSHSQHFLLRAKPRALVAFDINWRTSTLAVTSREPNPDILLYSYPDKKLRGKLQHGAPFEYAKLKFSRCGRRLVSLRPMADSEDEAGASTPGKAASARNMEIAATASAVALKPHSKRQRVCVWDIEQLEPVKGCAQGVLTIDAAFVSFDPTNPDQFVVGGDDGLQIWKLYRGKSSSLLRHVNVRAMLGSRHRRPRRASSGAGDPEDPTNADSLDLDVKRGQWVSHAWVKNNRVLASNKAGELVLVDTVSAAVVQVIEAATVDPARCWIAGIVYTADSVVLAYSDGRILWLSEKHWEVMQTAALPGTGTASAMLDEGAANGGSSLSPSSAGLLSSGAGSLTESPSLVTCMASSPNHSKVYVGTREGNIYELKSSVLQDEEEEDDESGGDGSGDGMVQTSASGNDAHLVIPCGSYPVGAVLSSAALTPSGGTFQNDALVASGGVNGHVYLWSVGKCRLVVEASVALVFAHSPSTPHAGASSAMMSTAAGSPSQISTSQPDESLPSAGGQDNVDASSSVLVTALAARPADPILMVGDQTGRLRAICVSKIVGSDGEVELIPLHSKQLLGDSPVDILEMHPTQAVVLAASTRSNVVFLISMDHEQHFHVLAYSTLLAPKEHVVDVKWSVPTHNASALIVTCFSSRGLFYVARYQPTGATKLDEVTAIGGGIPPQEMKLKVVASGEDMLRSCTSLKFLHNAPMSMVLGISPQGNNVQLMKCMEVARDPTEEKSSISSKVLAQDVHENGVATMALYPRTLATGSELVATAGMNGAITIWLISFGAAASSASSSSSTVGRGASMTSKEWQLEDVQAAKKKTIFVHSGPVTSLMFLTVGDDDVYLVSTGSDGCVFLLDVRIPPEMKAPLTALDEQNMNPLYLNITTFAKYDDTFNPAHERDTKPFLQALKENEELYARTRFDRLKDQTRAQLTDLEMKLKVLLAENEKLPETEKLPRDEFVINVGWRDHLLRKNKERADRVREGIMKDLAKMNIVRERMKHEFWDSATVQGVRLRGLSPPPAPLQQQSGSHQNASGLSVYNFPMRRQCKQELRTAKKIELMRMIEYAHQQQEAAAPPPPSSGSRKETTLSRFQEVLSPNLQWLIDAGIHHPSLNKWLTEKSTSPGAPASITKESSSNAATTSSLLPGAAGILATNVNELQTYHLVYHPAAIRTRKQQRIQIHLLKSFVRLLVVEFNGEFNALVQLKESKIEEIDVKNARIVEICAELGTSPHDLIYRPQWRADEIAKSILDVKPEEMTQAMYETEEMRRKREKDAAEALELERQRQKDDVAGRALRDMMDGTLEVKKENLATQSFVKEKWMLETPLDEMTAEQKKLVAQFDAAQQKFLEEKEKYKKSLDLELKKIRGEVNDICRAFDDKLRALQETYLQMRRSVLVQHLYELRLAEDLVDHEHLLLRRQQIEASMNDLQLEIQKSETENDLFAVQLESSKDEWHRAVDEDKSCEKNFLKELDELAGAGVALEHDLVKHLLELYKKRKGDDLLRDGGDLLSKKGGAKRGKSSQHLSMGASSAALNIGGGIGAASSAKQRLLAERLPSDPSSRQLSAVTLLQSLQSSNSDGGDDESNVDPFQYLDSQQQAPLHRLDSSGGLAASQRHVVPLDYEVDRPDGVLIEDRVWRALNALRTKKILAEHASREKAEQYALAKGVADELRYKLTELQFALQDQVAACDATTRQLEALGENSPLLVHIKQGQDESSSSIHPTPDDLCRCAVDSDSSFLVARSSVESLNDVIQLHGKDQVGILSKIKNFRKNINVMEWEHALLEMQTKDMEERYTDIQLLRVTKDLQELFHTGDTSEKQKREVALLEAKLVHLGKTHQTNLIKLDQTSTKLHTQLRDRLRENQGFDDQVQQLAMHVQIREDILSSRKSAALRSAALPAASSSASSENPQLKAIIVRRKLVDLAKAQTGEIEFLRMELDKMRRRTFPSFVHHQQGATRDYHPSDTKY